MMRIVQKITQSSLITKSPNLNRVILISFLRYLLRNFCANKITTTQSQTALDRDRRKYTGGPVSDETILICGIVK